MAPAVRRAGAADRPVVAARRETLGQRVPRGRNPVFGARSQIERLGVGDGLARQGAALHRRIPHRPGRRQEIAQRRRQNVVNQRLRPLVFDGAVLQHQEHAERDQQRVLLAPRDGCDAHHQVFPGRPPQRLPSCLDSLDVGAQQFAVGAGQHREGDAGAKAKTVQPGLAILGRHCGPEQLGQFAGAVPSQQVHLKEAVLPVDEAGGKRHIRPIHRVQRRDAALVALDAHGRGNAFDRDPSFERRQTAGQQQTDPAGKEAADHHGQGNQGGSHAEQRPRAPGRGATGGSGCGRAQWLGPCR